MQFYSGSQKNTKYAHTLKPANGIIPITTHVTRDLERITAAFIETPRGVNSDYENNY